jgi:hypothetical protein
MYEGIFVIAFALYTMQNGIGGRLFRGVGGEYFFEKRE